MAALTPKQERFVAEYLVDLNGTQAAIRAGYAAKNARTTAAKMLAKSNIEARVSELQTERAERTGITAERVLEELAKLGFSNMLDYLNIGANGDAYVDLSRMTREQAAAVQEVTVEDAREIRRVKFKLADKKSSLELLGKHLKLFTEKHEHAGAGGGPIQMIEVISEDGAGDEDEEQDT